MRPMAEALVEYDWLRGYSTIDGIRRSMDGLARRFTFMQDLRGAEKELVANFAYYQAAFGRFFPELMLASARYITENKDQRNPFI